MDHILDFLSYVKMTALSALGLIQALEKYLAAQGVTGG